MSDRWLRGAVAVCAAFGATLTVYLLYVRYAGAELLCTSSGCEQVQSSKYSEIVGVPVAALGFVAYLTLFATSWSGSDLARSAQAAIALAAFTFSAYLVYVQLVLIDAVCEWCLVSDGVTTGVAALVLLRLRGAVRV